jgi:hypothetical protein
MASSMTISAPRHKGARLKVSAVKIPNPKNEGEEQKEGEEEDVPLPQTLVRIPTTDAPKLQQATATGGVGGE